LLNVKLMLLFVTLIKEELLFAVLLEAKFRKLWLGKSLVMPITSKVYISFHDISGKWGIINLSAPSYSGYPI